VGEEKLRGERTRRLNPKDLASQLKSRQGVWQWERKTSVRDNELTSREEREKLICRPRKVLKWEAPIAHRH